MNLLVEENQLIIKHVLQNLCDCGIEEIVICPGGRNAPFVSALDQTSFFKVWYWSEERSAAFFAIGRIKATNKPVAIITTSGSAVAELFPAVMESFYSNLPLLCLTADRPKEMRGTGAPQTVNQYNIFGVYTPFFKDVEEEEFTLQDWDLAKPAHLNICLTEPLELDFEPFKINIAKVEEPKKKYFYSLEIEKFFERNSYPFVIVSHIPFSAIHSVCQFLKNLKAPLYLEASSQLREHPDLQQFRIHFSENLLEEALANQYPIDSILRIGGVPTLKFWRVLNKLKGKFDLLSIDVKEFPGITWGNHIQYALDRLHEIQISTFFDFTNWRKRNLENVNFLYQLMKEEPLAEPSLIHSLSKKIAEQSIVYLGNSLPIREWDGFASSLYKNSTYYSSRGVNGIDGQLSTFLGITNPLKNNWGIFGDLTVLYDMAAPWIIKQLPETIFSLAIINNGGGKIFERMHASKSMLNSHDYQFDQFAKMWNLSYEKCNCLPNTLACGKPQVLEIIPDNDSTTIFWKKWLAFIKQN